MLNLTVSLTKTLESFARESPGNIKQSTSSDCCDLSPHLDNSSFIGAKDILGRVPLLARETGWLGWWCPEYSSEVLISLTGKINYRYHFHNNFITFSQ